MFAQPIDVVLAGGPVRLYSAGPADGPPILLLHGAMLDTAELSWGVVGPRLAERHRVYAIDLPRHGGSRPWLGPVGQVRLEAVVDGLLAELGVDRIQLIGLSMGAGVALGYLLRHPERVSSAILIAPGGLESRRPLQFLTWVALNTPRLMRLTTAYLSASPTTVRRSMAMALRHGSGTTSFDRIVELAQQEARSKRRRHEPALDDWQVLAYGPRRMRLNFQPELGAVSVPTLWVRGDGDPLVSQVDLDAAAAATPGSVTAVVADAGHLVPLDQPETLLALITGFSG
ncbi:MAG TPA: alpha/beta hydrolase [Propionibacteriaceae bacterium]